MPGTTMNNQGFVQSNGAKIFYQIRGKGNPLVLLMGFGADGNVWEKHAAEYEKHFQCIILDNRGVGLSDAPKGPYSTSLMAEDTLAVMDHLGVEKAMVAGISMGGAIAQELALNYPGRVTRLLLIATWPRFNPYAKTVYENLKKLRVTSTPEDFMELLQLWIFAAPYYEHSLAELKEGQQAAAGNANPQSRDGFEGQLDACIQHDTVDRLHLITAPTLITAGQMDIFTPPAFAEVLHEKIPDSRYELFPNAGHVHHWEDLGRFNRITTEFLLEGASTQPQPSIRLACETYTWQMPGEQYKGKLEHILAICQQAGFAGIEPETSFLHHLEDPFLLKEALNQYGMELASLCVVEDWLHPEETAVERYRSEKWIQLMAHFPQSILLLVQMPGKDRSNLAERQTNLLSCVNAFAKRAAEKGIICSYHPNSPEGSVFRTEADYEILLDGLDPEVIGYCPDVGHIAKGGMDPLAIIQRYRSRVNLVHYKDMFADGNWAPTGEGVIDFVGITGYLLESGYSGWIVMEDECDETITNPDGVTKKDSIYIGKMLTPLIAKKLN